jgi:hypothetical protein
VLFRTVMKCFPKKQMESEREGTTDKTVGRHGRRPSTS